jgi:hypothetical protein
VFPALATKRKENLCWYSDVIEKKKKKILMSLLLASKNVRHNAKEILYAPNTVFASSILAVNSAPINPL